MKLKRKLVITLCVIFVFLILLFIVIRDLDRVRRSVIADSGASHLAEYVELYRTDHNKYPTSLEDLQQKEPQFKVLVDGILNDAFRNKYEYKLLTNGFMITVTVSSPLWYKPDVIRKTNKPRQSL